jgi:hypothetical protein
MSTPAVVILENSLGTNFREGGTGHRAGLGMGKIKSLSSIGARTSISQTVAVLSTVFFKQ